MRIVTKSTFRQLRQLTDLEQASVIANYAGGNPTDKQRFIAQEIASFTKSSEAWLECNCMPVHSPAYLFPRQTDSGTITFVRPRPPRQNPHSPHCPFYLDELQSDPSQSKTNTSGTINDFCILKPEKTSSSSKPPSPEFSASLSSEKALPRLTRILLNLLDQAHINKLDNHFPFFDAYLPIYRLSSTIPMWPGSTMMLSEVLSAHTSIAYYYRLVNRLKSMPKFSQSHRKQGYFVTLVSEFSEYSLTLNSGHSIQVVGKVTGPNRVPAGPYWAIVLVAETREGSNYFDAIRASVWPAYSEKLPFPVDSDFERATLRDLISWRLYWSQKGHEFTITKPLDFSTPIKPDFLVLDKESGAQVVIETMGSDDETYLDRKRRTHIEMRKLGPLIEHRPSDEALAFKKHITAAIVNYPPLKGAGLQEP